MDRRSTFFILILLAIGLGTSCSKPTEGPQPAEEANTLNVYPHTESFTKVEHGTTFFKEQNLCFKCHGADGSNTKVNCNSCHAGFPLSNKVNHHPENWGDPENHGHGFKVLGREGKRRCASCHTTSSQRNTYFGDPLYDLGENPNRRAPLCLDCHDDSIFRH